MKRHVGTSARIREASCPHCGEKMDSEGDPIGLDMPPPNPGNVSVCFRCTGFLCFDLHMEPQRLTQDAFMSLESPMRAALLEIRDLTLAYWRKKGRLSS